MNDGVPIYILAGGRSSRFGSDKARAMLWGRPLLAHVIESVEPIASRITVVADVAGRYDDMGVRTIGDGVPGAGPVEGLRAALRDCGEPWLLLTSCDFVGIDRAWLDTLLRARGGGVRAAAFRGDRWQPMLSVWRSDALVGEARSMQAALDTVGAAALPLPHDWPANPGVNTREDLQRFV